jgi:hypothetical protein
MGLIASGPLLPDFPMKSPISTEARPDCAIVWPEPFDAEKLSLGGEKSKCRGDQIVQKYGLTLLTLDS